MITVENGKIFMNNEIVYLPRPVFEAVEINDNIIVVYKPSRDEYDNVFCYSRSLETKWRIPPVPVEIGGTGRCVYVAVRVINGDCYVTDFGGRRFKIDAESGIALSMEFVK